MNRDFIRIAHRRAAIMELQRVLMDVYISSETTAKKEVTCDEVPFSEKTVTQDALVDVYETLERLQQDERTEMSKFEFRRRDDGTVKQPKETSAPRPKKEKRKRVKRKRASPGKADEGGTPTESSE